MNLFDPITREEASALDVRMLASLEAMRKRSGPVYSDMMEDVIGILSDLVGRCAT
jgi:hypothetical protein